METQIKKKIILYLLKNWFRSGGCNISFTVLIRCTEVEVGCTYLFCCTKGSKLHMIKKTEHLLLQNCSVISITNQNMW